MGEQGLGSTQCERQFSQQDLGPQDRMGREGHGISSILNLYIYLNVMDGFRPWRAQSPSSPFRRRSPGLLRRPHLPLS